MRRYLTSRHLALNSTSLLTSWYLDTSPRMLTTQDVVRAYSVSNMQAYV